MKRCRQWQEARVHSESITAGDTVSIEDIAATVSVEDVAATVSVEDVVAVVPDNSDSGPAYPAVGFQSGLGCRLHRCPINRIDVR